ncbi:RidA family protein [Actinoplanes subglobosus]|uniref:RidA family protein n=1 Tax=Actinoplanes subglobosus TaxID=1547892 RepID=A0ABV8J0V0_9ACTN
MNVRHINPGGLHRAGAFSQAVVVEHPTKTIWIGGQSDADAVSGFAGRTIGEQTVRTLRTIATVLEAEDATLANVVHWTVAIVEGNRADECLAAFRQVWDPADPPPAVTVHFVAGLGPDQVVQIGAVAVV